MHPQGVVAACVEALLPSLCIHCGEPLGGRDLGLCAACWTMVVPLAGSRCPWCGGPAEDVEEACPDCTRHPPPQTHTVIWGEYDGALRSAVLALKHRGRDELGDPLGRRLAGRLAVEDWSRTIDMVVPVPSHPVRRLRRGPAAAEALATSVARALGRPFASPLSRRGLARQAGRTRAQRLQLDPRSFRCSADLDRRRPLLVDDVTTTGATLRRAAEVLRTAGASAVCCAALAVTPDPRRLT